MLRFAIAVASSIAIVVVAALATLQRPIVGAATRPQDQRGAWAYDLATRLGNTQPSAETIAFLVEWTLAEDSSGGAFSRNNPLNTTQASGADTMVINSDGVRGYADYETGMAATIRTLTNGLYNDVVAGIQANDPGRARAALIASPWASSHYGYGADWPHVAPVQSGATDRQSYLLAGDVGVNVRAALDANGGALRSFVIPPGATWSFGHSIAPISALGYLPIVCGPAGCNAGGGWCDLAAMYVRVADQIGLRSEFPPHGGISDPRFPGILLDANGGGGDLRITNTLDRPVTFSAIERDGSLVVAAE